MIPIIQQMPGLCGGGSEVSSEYFPWTSETGDNVPVLAWSAEHSTLTMGTNVQEISDLGQWGVPLIQTTGSKQMALNATDANFNNKKSLAGSSAAATYYVADLATGLATFTGNTTLSSPVITGISSIAGLEVNQRVYGTGLPSYGGYIVSIDSATQITLSQNATSTTSGSTFQPNRSISSKTATMVIIAKKGSDPPASLLNAGLYSANVSAGDSPNQPLIPHTDGKVYESFNKLSRNTLVNFVGSFASAFAYRAVSDASTYDFYLNGTLEASSTPPSIRGFSRYFVVGCSYESGVPYFVSSSSANNRYINGPIAAVFVWAGIDAGAFSRFVSFANTVWGVTS